MIQPSSPSRTSQAAGPGVLDSAANLTALAQTPVAQGLVGSRLKVDAPYVLGLYSSGGGGHVSALDSIERSLQGCIDIRRMAPLRDVLHSIDPIARMTLGKLDGELLFNSLAARGKTGLLGLLEKAGTRRVFTKRRAMTKLFRKALAANPPSLIVSTMPFINAAMSDVAHEMGIPFIIVPTDYDIGNFIAGLPTPLPASQHVAHGFAEQSSEHGGEHAGTCLGYPLRPQFANPITASQYETLRAERNIAPDTKVIVITMGSAGGTRALHVAESLARHGQGKNYHLVICCGRNKKLLQRAQQLRAPGVTIEARGYTSDMVGLLGLSDLLITKPGGGTVMEAMALGVRLAIDNAIPCVPWERGNLKFAVRYGATTIGRHDHVPAAVDAALAQPRAFTAATHFPDFVEGFRALVTSLLAKQ